MTSQYDYSLLKSYGQDVFISENVDIRRPHLITIGNYVAIDSFVVITTRLEVGSHVHISPHCSIIGGEKSKLIMKDFSGFSAGCRIACASDDYTGKGLTNPMVPQKYRTTTHSVVTMEKFATLGTGVIVHPGITIGEGAVVGSGSVITKNLKPWGIYVGSPARWVKERDRKIIYRYEKEIVGKKL